jgi:hypothetical protein
MVNNDKLKAKKAVAVAKIRYCLSIYVDTLIMYMKISDGIVCSLS